MTFDDAYYGDDGTPALVHLVEVPPLYAWTPGLYTRCARSNDLGL